MEGRSRSLGARESHLISRRRSIGFGSAYLFFFKWDRRHKEKRVGTVNSGSGGMEGQEGADMFESVCVRACV